MLSRPPKRHHLSGMYSLTSKRHRHRHTKPTAHPRFSVGVSRRVYYSILSVVLCLSFQSRALFTPLLMSLSDLVYTHLLLVFQSPQSMVAAIAKLQHIWSGTVRNFITFLLAARADHVFRFTTPMKVVRLISDYLVTSMLARFSTYLTFKRSPMKIPVSTLVPVI